MTTRRGIIVDGVKLDRRAASEVYDEVVASARGANRAKFLLLIGIAVLIPLGPVLVAAKLFAWAERQGPNGFPIVMLMTACMGMLTAIALAVLFTFVFTRVFRREIRTAMGDQGYRLCPGCGYWLKGLKKHVRRCPECGESLEPANGSDGRDDG